MSTIYTRATKGSALTWTEGDANITNLNNDKIEDIVEDTTPQLGGNLDVNGNSIVSASNGNIAITPNGTGSIVLDGLSWPQADGTANQVIKTDGAGNLSFTTVTSGISDVVADTTPQLGGNLDVNGKSIVSVSNGDIILEPNGTGDVWLRSDSVLVGDDNASAFITTIGTGSLTLSTNSGSSSGNITITQGVNGNITVTPNGTGQVQLNRNVRIGEAGSDAIITTSASSDLWLWPSASGAKITVGTANNSNITLAPNGTGQTVVKNLEYNEYIHALGTTGGTIAPNVANGNVQTITLNSALTINGFTSPVAGQSLTLIINGGTAYTSITSTMKFAGGVKTLTGTAGCIDILSVFYDGTTYYASLGKGFA